MHAYGFIDLAKGKDMLSKKMKAAIYRGEGSIGIEEVDVPSPEPRYVLLEMKNCGISVSVAAICIAILGIGDNPPTLQAMRSAAWRLNVGKG